MSPTKIALAARAAASISASGGVALPASSKIATRERHRPDSGVAVHACAGARDHASLREPLSGGALRADRGEVVLWTSLDTARHLIWRAVTRACLGVEQVRGRRSARRTIGGCHGSVLIDPVPLTDRLVHPADRVFRSRAATIGRSGSCFASRSSTLSTAWWVCAASRICACGSFARYCQTISQIVVVFPVPGGP